MTNIVNFMFGGCSSVISVRRCARMAKAFPGKSTSLVKREVQPAKVQYATEKSWDNIEIRVYGGADGAFTLYEDENDTHNY